MKKFLLTEVVKICCQLYQIKKDTDFIKQDFDHAKKMLAEAVQGYEDFSALLAEILKLKDEGKLSESESRKVLITLLKFHRDQIMFDEACLSTLGEASLERA